MCEVTEITTTALTENRYYRFTGNAMVFEVKGKSNAGILLAQSPKSPTMIIVSLGGNENTTCSIKSHDRRTVTIYRPHILSEHEYRKFWLTWINDSIALGQFGNVTPIISCRIDNIDINSVEFASDISLKHPLHWRFLLPPLRPSRKLKPINGGEPKWLPLIDNEVPEDAIIAGCEDEPLYIIRAHHRYSLTPGKYIPLLETGFISWGGEAHPKVENLEILCGYNFMWDFVSDCCIPATAVVGGYSEQDREPLYVGRAYHCSKLIVGKVQPSHKGLYIPVEDSEVYKRKFEILVCPSYDKKHCRINGEKVYYREDYCDDSSDELSDDHFAL